ncbi:MAG: DUF3800 domain-containing protein [Christensenella sp.]|nr:DUF3800 domain-containing protein [Christensenella sp.]
MTNIYCDESCHLEHDHINVMVLGAVWCPKDKVKSINERIRKIKQRNNVNATSEIKWTKVSPAKSQLYSDIIDYFFDDDDLHFRCVVVPNKELLNHQYFRQSHDDWYYKMYFDLLKVIFSPYDSHDVYIDKKDRYSTAKCKKLHEVCCNSKYDFSAKIITKIQPIQSHEVQIMQIVDILTGAMGYHNRKFPENELRSNTKADLIELIKERSNCSLDRTTLLKEEKFNILIWNATTIEV